MRIEWSISVGRSDVMIAVIFAERGIPATADDLRAVSKALAALARTVDKLRDGRPPHIIAKGA